jgi:alpha-amylase
MSEWSLPSSAQEHFEEFVRQNDSNQTVKPFIRGGFWRNFLNKYEESNNIHKKMLYMSSKIYSKKVKGKKITDELQKFLYAGQCNCAYWHGVFGGLYLPHLRKAIYENLLKAENLYNKKFGIKKGWTAKDFDCDAINELLYESENQNIYVDLENGGSIFEFDVLKKNYNFSNVLTRRYEHYHKKLQDAIQNNRITDSITSIHTDAVKVKELGLENHLVYDWYRKSSLLDHFFHIDTKYDRLYNVKFVEDGDFVLGKYDAKIISNKLQLTRKGHVWFDGSHLPVEVVKVINPLSENGYEVEYSIKNLSDKKIDFLFGVEQVFAFSEKTDEDVKEFVNVNEWTRKDDGLNVMAKISSSINCDIWVTPIQTVSNSDNGYEKTYQGTTVVNVYRFSLDVNKLFSFKIKTEIIDTAKRTKKWKII